MNDNQVRNCRNCINWMQRPAEDFGKCCAKGGREFQNMTEGSDCCVDWEPFDELTTMDTDA